MTVKNIVLQNTDLLFHLTDFLDDKSSFRLLNANKHYNTLINKYPNRYSIKKVVSSQSDMKYPYKIERYNVHENKPIEELNIPSRVKVLIISCEYSYPINDGNLPPNVKGLVLKNFNQSVDNLSSTLESLTFGDVFNQPVDNLPSGLKHLVFGDAFNQSVDKLSSSLESVTFGKSFNKVIDKLPSSLRCIVFGEMFNQCVDILPLSLESLTFSYWFNQPLLNLSLSVRKLQFV